MTIELKPWDAADVLTTEERIEAYLEEAFESNDARIIARALGAVARARKMSELAKQTDLSREALYRSLSAEGNPRLSTLLAVAGALGFQLSVKRAPAASAAGE